MTHRHKGVWMKYQNLTLTKSAGEIPEISSKIHIDTLEFAAVGHLILTGVKS